MGLHHVHGDWLVDYDGQEIWVEDDFWTLRILADEMGLTVGDIRYHRRMGRFPALKVKETGQYLVEIAVGKAVAEHWLKHEMWLTFRVIDGKIVMFNEPYGSRPHGRRVLAETGQLHVPPGGTALAITAPLEVAPQGVDQR